MTLKKKEVFPINLIGMRIANHRKKQNLSLTELANGIISISYLSNIEHGRKIPSVETLLDLAESLQLEAKELILDEDKHHTEELAQQFELIFDLIVADDFQKGAEQLNAINQRYQLAYEATETEICYYLLQAIIAIKKWDFVQFDRVYQEHLVSLDYRLLSNKSLGYYAYLQAINAQQDMNYLQAGKWFKVLLEQDLPLKTILHTNLHFAITMICDSQYEEAIETIHEMLALIADAHREHHEQKIPAYYLLGFAYHHIGLYKFAHNHLKTARDLLPTSPNMTKNYQMVILFWLSQSIAKQAKGGSLAELNDDMYDLFIEKFTEKDALVRNDYLPLAELLIYYGEISKLTRAKQILTWFDQLAELPADLHFHLTYGKALIAYFQGENAQFEDYLLPLLTQLDKCNNPLLLEKIKTFLSRHYAKNKRYKRSYELMLETRSS